MEWGEADRQGARDAVAELLRGRMDQVLDEHLERMAELGQPTAATAAIAAGC